MRFASVVFSSSVLAVFIGSCASDTSELRDTAAELGEGCSINSDCEKDLICAFGKCHVECQNTEQDCDPPAQCVFWQPGVGVCQLLMDDIDEVHCQTHADCAGKQRCSAAGICRDACIVDEECLDSQICVASYCEDGARPDGGTDAGPDASAGGTGGTGGTGGGGSGGVGGNGGTGGGGTGGAGGTGGTGGTAGSSATGGTGGVAGSAGSSGGSSTLPTPIAYWPLDSIGGAMADAAGDLDGEYKNAQSDPNGKFGKAISFSGNNQYALIDNEPALTTPTGLAITAWIKPLLGLSSSTGTQTIVKTQSWILQHNGSVGGGSLQFSVHPSSGAIKTLSVPMTASAGVWTHVVATYDAANGNVMALYVDGVLGNSGAGPGSIDLTPGDLYVGQATSTTNPFIGSIDELSFFDKGLSQADVTALHGATQTVTACSACVQPVAHWPLDDDPDPKVLDVVGGSHGFNVSGSVAVSGGMDAKVGSALRFVDAGDRVDIPNSPTLNPTAALSIALWVRPAQSLSGTDPLTAFFDKEHGGAGYALLTGNTQNYRMLVGNVWAAETTNTTFAAQSWHHLAGTWDGSTVRLYIDGSLAAEEAKPTPLSPYTGKAMIAETFRGTVDEVVLYDAALSGPQISELHARGDAGLPAN